MREKLKKYNPTVTKKQLLLVASFVWFFAGSMLISKGIYFLVFESKHVFWELVFSSIFGLLFYHILFTRISLKHINRINAMEKSRPYLYSFFDLKGYIMMSIMISGGITLRKLDIINHDILFSFYVTMGIPLLLSAIRFYLNWLRYNNIVNNEKIEEEN